MKQFSYKGQIITASSKQEAINKICSRTKVTAGVKSINYDDPNIINNYRDNAVKGINFDKLLRVLVDAGIYFAQDLEQSRRYRAAYDLNGHKELQRAVRDNDLEGVKKFVKEYDNANMWDGTSYPALGKKPSTIAKDILSRYHKNVPYEVKIDKKLLMEKAMQRAVHDAGVNDIGQLSDGHHTYDDLYFQRLILWQRICKDHKDKCWKTKRHDDGELCFGGTNFLICVDTPEGPYSYHYDMKEWDRFDVKELPKAKPFDGHTSKDVERILSL